MHGLKVIGSFVLILLLFFGSLFGLGWLAELRRRRKWDKAGFADFLRAGAPLDHREFLDAFRKAPFSKDSAQISVHRAGALCLAGGRIAAGDPVYVSQDESLDKETFDQFLPPGEYPVDMLVGKNIDQRCFAIRVGFSQNPERRLAPAWSAFWRGRALKTRTLPRFGVDSATAGVFAAEILPKVADLVRELAAAPRINPYLSDNPMDLWSPLREGDALLGVNACSGLGDGAYHCYFSFDDQNKPVALYVDFGFFGGPKWAWDRQP